MTCLTHVECVVCIKIVISCFTKYLSVILRSISGKYQYREKNDEDNKRKKQKEKQHLQGDGVKTRNIIADVAGQRNSSQLMDENFVSKKENWSQGIARLPKNYS